MNDFLLRDLGLVDYAASYAAMQSFTAQREASTPDEVWFCQHPPVFTQGLAGKAEHLLLAGDIPVVQSNRGGQVTYHGPGQIVAYPLINLQRRGYFVKEFVYKIEESLIRTLAEFGLTGHRLRGAPGVYVRLSAPDSHARLSDAENSTANPDLGKIAALGIKVARHCTYHGLALNVAMDLRPYLSINPCGYAGLRTVDMASCGVQTDVAQVQSVLAAQLQRWLA
ncbi:MAG: lipoyl(octanoyl) transferase LipB [Brachymonas sp.]